MLSEIFALASLAFIAWFWFDSLRARERSTRAARKLCEEERVQLLDDTVALGRLWLGRSAAGRVQVCRIYLFDFVDVDDERRQGLVVAIGSTVREAQLTRTSHDLLH